MAANYEIERINELIEETDTELRILNNMIADQDRENPFIAQIAKVLENILYTQSQISNALREHRQYDIGY